MQEIKDKFQVGELVWACGYFFTIKEDEEDTYLLTGNNGDDISFQKELVRKPTHEELKTLHPELMQDYENAMKAVEKLIDREADLMEVMEQMAEALEDACVTLNTKMDCKSGGLCETLGCTIFNSIQAYKDLKEGNK